MKCRHIWIGWGPGGNSKFEEKWFEGIADLKVWNQPLIKTATPHAWTSFLKNGTDFLSREVLEAKQQGELTHLILHSSGLQIFLQWLKEGNDPVFDQVTVLASNFNPLQAYENLGKKRGFYQFDSTHPTAEQFGALAQVLMSDPDLYNSYWAHPDSQIHQRYLQLQESIPHLTMETFFTVIQDLLSSSESKTFDPNHADLIPSSLPIRVFLGSKDPLIEIESESARWKEKFPHSKIEILDAGHFPHFELPTLQIFKLRSA